MLLAKALEKTTRQPFFFCICVLGHMPIASALGCKTDAAIQDSPA
jgi:hypothetical protein